MSVTSLALENRASLVSHGGRGHMGGASSEKKCGHGNERPQAISRSSRTSRLRMLSTNVYVRCMQTATGTVSDEGCAACRVAMASISSENDAEDIAKQMSSKSPWQMGTPLPSQLLASLTLRL